MRLEKRPLGRDEFLEKETLDLGFRHEVLTTALDDGYLPPLDALIELIPAHAQAGACFGGGEELNHNSPRNFWMSERVRKRRTLILPFTRNLPHDIDIPTSLAISPTDNARYRAWAMNLLMSSLSPFEAFMFNLCLFITLLALIVKQYVLI